MTVTIPEAADIEALINTAIKVKSDTTPRTMQSKAGMVGPSDIGFCRNKAALKIKGRQESDSKSAWAANVGTAIHEWVESALTIFPTWQIEVGRLTATLPNGAEITGTPDIIVPEWNAVLDIKTVNGFEGVRRFGTSQNHKFQRFLYYLAAVQAGILQDGNGYVGNVYFDRSGAEKECMVIIEEVDWTLLDEIDSWVSDVIYAVQHEEDAMRDIAAPVCDMICEFFTECRGQLPVSEMEVIDSPDIIAMAQMYDEGKRMEKIGKRMKEEAKGTLSGLNGIAGEFQIRTTHIDGSDIAATFRSGYDRLDVSKVRR